MGSIPTPGTTRANFRPSILVCLFVDGFRHDLRGALRALTRRPAFSAVAILTLAAGIGLNAVAFTAANALFFKGPAGAHLPGAGWIFQTERSATGQHSIRDFEELVRSTRSFSIVAAEGRLPLALSWAGQTEQTWALIVSRSYFDAIDERPLAGRSFNTASDADDRAVLVNERFWSRHFGEAALAGQTITLNGVDFGVIGIIRDDAQGPGGLYTPDVYVPLGARRAMQLPARLDDPESRWLTVLARLAPGATPADARGELTSFFKGRPGAGARAGGDFVLLREKHPEARGLRWFGVVGMSAVAIVLLIACFNVAGLLLARSLERAREMAVRRALGAGTARLARQLLTENVVLAAAAGVAAMLVAFWSGSLLSSFAIPAPIPQRLDLRPDGTVLAFVAALVVIAGALPAIAPALQAMRLDVARALKGDSAGGGKPSKARGYFVALQVAGSTLFLAIAMVFGISLASTLATDPGFEKENALVLQVDPSLQGFGADETRAFVDAFVEEFAATPGVSRVGSGDRMSFYVGYPHFEEVSPAEKPCAGDDCPNARTYKVAAGYFEAIGIPIVAGRALTEEEIKAGRGVVVSAHLAGMLWPGQPPVGQVLRLGQRHQLHEVVGVASDIKHHMMHEAPVRAIYLPMADDDYRGAVTIVARTSVPPSTVVPAARDTWRALDARLPAPAVQTMRERLALPLWPVRTAAWFFGVCGVLAVLLATVGLFGAIAYAVAQRTREFGIRAAIGASAARLERLVLRDALVLAGPGVVIGLAAAWLLARAAGSRLAGVDAADPAVYAAVAALQLFVAMAACLWPARRAGRADPMLSLRGD